MTIEIAKNLGFIARLNGIERAPVRDPKFQEMTKAQSPLSKLMRAWISGWDECNLEYAKYPGSK